MVFTVRSWLDAWLSGESRAVRLPFLVPLVYFFLTRAEG